MQSTIQGRRHIENDQIAPMATRRDAAHATAGDATLVVLPLLFVAGLVYLAFGDTLETSWAIDAETRIAAPAATPAHAGVSPRKQNAPGSSAAAADYLPAAYADRGRDGDGNVMTYEHD